MDTPIQPDDIHEEGSTDAPIPEHFSSYVDYLKRIPALSRAQQLEMHAMANDPDEPAVSRRWAEQRLWLDSLKFVVFVRMQMRRSLPFVRLDDMDILQEGNIAAGAALKRWTPKAGTLTTWLYPHVRGAFLSYAGKESSIDQRAISLDAVVGSEIGADTLETGFEDEPVTLAEVLQYDKHVFDDPETITEYGQVRRLLVEQHGKDGWGDLAADFLIGETNVRELAAKYGVTVPTVYNRMRKMGF